MAEAENHLPGPTYDSWRSWLMTGARRVPLDPRRLQGTHRGLKKILGEGATNVAESPYTWKEFSGAMVRHAVDDAMRSLPAEDTKVLKLAYFGGYSNRQIAMHVGLTEGAVQRRLRRALESISDHIQHGGAFARRALYALGLLLCGRWLTESVQRALPAVAIAGVAAVIVAAQPDGPQTATPVAPATRAPAAAPVVPPVPSPTAPVSGQGATWAGGAASSSGVTVPAAGVPSVTAPSVQLPSVALPKVPVPSPPALPKLP